MYNIIVLYELLLKLLATVLRDMYSCTKTNIVHLCMDLNALCCTGWSQKLVAVLQTGNQSTTLKQLPILTPVLEMWM